MGREQRQEDREAKGRQKRIPLGTPRLKLDAAHLIPKGYRSRWVNDDPGRIARAEQGGYVHVVDPDAEVGEGAENLRDQTSAKVRQRVGVRKDGTPVMAYLMMIKDEFYKEDQDAKEAERRQMEDTMRRGKAGADEGHDTDERYFPGGGVQIEHGL